MEWDKDVCRVSIRCFNISEASLTRPINDPTSIVISYLLNIIHCFHKSTRRQDIPRRYTSMKEKKLKVFFFLHVLTGGRSVGKSWLWTAANASWQLIIAWVRVRKILRRHQLAQKSRGVYFDPKSRKKRGGKVRCLVTAIFCARTATTVSTSTSCPPAPRTFGSTAASSLV